MSDIDHGGVPALPPVVLSCGRHAPDEPPPLAPAPDLDTVETATRHYRHDGWTPTARATFLDMLARSGVVTDACREVQFSSQAAYALRNRDGLFAAGWDAALSMARVRLADELYHRAINGTVEQIWKDGEIVAERHRHDNRLSIAVLNRLDARCDRAQQSGAPTLRIAANWDAWLAALAEDRVADAQAMLDPPAPVRPLDILGHGSESTLIHQLHQLRDGHALDEDANFEVDDDHADEGEARIWFASDGWRTNFPPPDDFFGDEVGLYGEDDYDRACSADEAALLDRHFPDAGDDVTEDQVVADETARDAFFASLAVEEEAGDTTEGDATAEDAEDEEEEEKASPGPVKPRSARPPKGVSPPDLPLDAPDSA